jgi:hypothetical protein
MLKGGMALGWQPAHSGSRYLNALNALNEHITPQRKAQRGKCAKFEHLHETKDVAALNRLGTELPGLTA